MITIIIPLSLSSAKASLVSRGEWREREGEVSRMEIYLVGAGHGHARSSTVMCLQPILLRV